MLSVVILSLREHVPKMKNAYAPPCLDEVKKKRVVAHRMLRKDSILSPSPCGVQLKNKLQQTLLSIFDKYYGVNFVEEVQPKMVPIKNVKWPNFGDFFFNMRKNDEKFPGNHFNI